MQVRDGGSYVFVIILKANSFPFVVLDIYEMIYPDVDIKRTRNRKCDLIFDQYSTLSVAAQKYPQKKIVFFKVLTIQKKTIQPVIAKRTAIFDNSDDLLNCLYLT